MEADTLDLGALSLNIPLTRSLERLLQRAAATRDQSPEVLAQRILCEWLLAEGGFKQESASRRETKRDNPRISLTA